MTLSLSEKTDASHKTIESMPHNKYLNKTKRTIVILIAAGLLLLVQGIYGNTGGYKYLRNYSHKEYENQPRNYNMVQAQNGILYFANIGGILEYDGVTWRVYYSEYQPETYSMAVDNEGVIFVGGNNSIRSLKMTPNGDFNWVSLLKHIEPGDKNFGHVWSTHALPGSVFFRSAKYLFRWNYRKMKVWPAPKQFKASFVYKGSLMVQDKMEGLFKLSGDSLEPMPGGDAFINDKVTLYATYHEKTIIWGNSSGKFFLYDGTSSLPFPTEAEKKFNEQNRLKHGIRMHSGDYALAANKGLLIIDPQGRLKYYLDKNYGLQDDYVRRVFQDIEGNLWLCLDNGISKFEYNSPISLYDSRCGLPGLVLCLVKQGNNYVVGTSQGLFVRDSSKNFSQVRGGISNCYSLTHSGDLLLAASDKGLFQVKTQNRIRHGFPVAELILQDKSAVLLKSARRNGIIWCGSDEGLVGLKMTDKHPREFIRWNLKSRIESIAESPDGSLWLGTRDSKVFHVRFTDGVNLQGHEITTYDSNQNLPVGEIKVVSIAGHAVFATERGLYRLDKNNDRFVPDTILGTKFASQRVFTIKEAEDSLIWFHSGLDNYRAVPQPDGSYRVGSGVLQRIPQSAQVNFIYPDPSGNIIWFATNEGLFSLDLKEKTESWDFKTLIRKVDANINQKNYRLIFNGAPVHTSPNDSLPALEYDERNLNFHFAAPFFQEENQTQYRYFLEGYDDDWSIWSAATRKSYTNLAPGGYSFKVQARNVYMHQGEKNTYSFKILAPWYLTWWMYILYGLLVIFFIVLLVHHRSRKLVREKEHLENTVKERTKEIRRKNVLLDRQSRELKEMDEVKSRFFANISHEFRTPLTMIMSPIEEMQSKLNQPPEPGNLEVMLRNSQRLLTLINQLLDLSRFDSGKVKLKAANQDIVSFLKGITGSFELLAKTKMVTLTFQPPGKEIFIYFDSRQLEEVFYNLLTNAFKFTPAQGTIRVSIDYEDAGDTVGISVQDTGAGISREHMPYIFNRFYQVEKQQIKSHKGTGIGLALSKEIVDLHHGTIDAHSHEGKGTEFVVKLMTGHEHFQPDEIVLPVDVQTDGKMKERLKSLDLGIKTPPFQDTPETEKRDETEKNSQLIILVVEDNRDVRCYIRKPLEAEGLLVIEAENGKEGIQKAKEIIPDLIVSDIMMPEADGYELCKQLKKDFNTSHIPIILLTARASEESELQGLKTGADDYIRKPFISRILLARIRNLIELRRQLQLKIQRKKTLLPEEIKITSADETFLKEFMAMIEKNYTEPEFNVEQLHKKLLMGKTTLYRKVQALTGETPHQFILSLRMEKAAQLLKQNYGNVTEVAMAVGFSNPQYFSQCFKERFQQSPSSYKASQSS